MLDKKLYTVSELSEKLSVSRQTIYRWRKDGLPYKKIFNSVRFDLSEVEEWVNEKNSERTV